MVLNHLLIADALCVFSASLSGLCVLLVLQYMRATCGESTHNMVLNVSALPTTMPIEICITY